MNMFIKGNQVRGHLETMVLSVLESEESHGFDGSLNLKEGTVYPVLYRLEDAKLLKAKWEENDSGRKGPRRKVYSLTAKGRKQLEAGRNEWKAFVNVVGGIVGGLS